MVLCVCVGGGGDEPEPGWWWWRSWDNPTGSGQQEEVQKNRDKFYSCSTGVWAVYNFKAKSCAFLAYLFNNHNWLQRNITVSQKDVLICTCKFFLVLIFIFYIEIVADNSFPTGIYKCFCNIPINQELEKWEKILLLICSRRMIFFQWKPKTNR